MIVDYRNVELIIDDNTIEYVTEFKLLGVWLDNNLNFTIHYIKIRSSINSYKYLWYKIKNHYVILIYYEWFIGHIYIAD